MKSFEEESVETIINRFNTTSSRVVNRKIWKRYKIRIETKRAVHLEKKEKKNWKQKQNI